MFIGVRKIIAKAKCRNKSWFRGLKWAEEHFEKFPNTAEKSIGIRCLPAIDAFDRGALDYLTHKQYLKRISNGKA